MLRSSWALTTLLAGTGIATWSASSLAQVVMLAALGPVVLGCIELILKRWLNLLRMRAADRRERTLDRYYRRALRAIPRDAPPETILRLARQLENRPPRNSARSGDHPRHMT
jgi:hypothetical protein